MRKTHRKGITNAPLLEIFAIFIVVLVAVGLWRPIGKFIGAIIPDDETDKRMENAMDRLVTEIESLTVGQSTTIPFDVDLSGLPVSLEAVNICLSGQHPSQNPCSDGRTTLCIRKGDGKRICKGVENVRLKPTPEGEYIYKVESRTLKITRTYSGEVIDKKKIDLLALEFVAG